MAQVRRCRDGVKALLMCAYTGQRTGVVAAVRRDEVVSAGACIFPRRALTHFRCNLLIEEILDDKGKN